MKPLVEPGPPLTPAEAARYARHLTLPDIGVTGQRRLRNARVLVIGAGGLGAPTLLYLAAAGVGTLGIVDDDVLDLSNLQRQVLHRDADLGRPKVESARDAIARLDPSLRVEIHPVRMIAENAEELFASYDLVLDGADNFATRYLSNDAAELTGTPLVWGTIFRFQGQVSVFWPGEGPMLRDLFPDIPPADSVPSCAEGGVFGVLCGTIGSAMATEALKLICGVGEPLVGRILIYDALRADYRTLALQPDPDREPVTSLADTAEACRVAAAPRAENAPRDSATEPGEATAAELAAARELGSGPPVVDVRDPWERDICVIPDSVPVPLDTIRSDGWDALVEALGAQPEGEVVVSCKAGVRSAEAIRLLSEQAPPGVRLRNLHGGVLAWITEVEGQRPPY